MNSPRIHELAIPVGNNKDEGNEGINRLLNFIYNGISLWSYRTTSRYIGWEDAMYGLIEAGDYYGFHFSDLLLPLHNSVVITLAYSTNGVDKDIHRSYDHSMLKETFKSHAWNQLDAATNTVSSTRRSRIKQPKNHIRLQTALSALLGGPLLGSAKHFGYGHRSVDMLLCSWSITCVRCRGTQLGIPGIQFRISFTCSWSARHHVSRALQSPLQIVSIYLLLSIRFVSARAISRSQLVCRPNLLWYILEWATLTDLDGGVTLIGYFAFLELLYRITVMISVSSIKMNTLYI